MGKQRVMKKLVVVFMMTVVVSGCAPALLVGGTTAAVVVNNDRSTGSIVEDQEIELKIIHQLSQADLLDKGNIDVVSYNRRVLLVGQIDNKKNKKSIVEIAHSIENVRQVRDQMEIIGASSLFSKAADRTLTLKVKAALCTLKQEQFSCLDIKVVSERGVVYLLGLVTRKQAAIAVGTVRDIKGVQKVVKVFEYLD